MCLIHELFREIDLNASRKFSIAAEFLDTFKENSSDFEYFTLRKCLRKCKLHEKDIEELSEIDSQNDEKNGRRNFSIINDMHRRPRAQIYACP